MRRPWSTTPNSAAIAIPTMSNQTPRGMLIGTIVPPSSGSDPRFVSGGSGPIEINESSVGTDTTGEGADMGPGSTVGVGTMGEDVKMRGSLAIGVGTADEGTVGVVTRVSVGGNATTGVAVGSTVGVCVTVGSFSPICDSSDEWSSPIVAIWDTLFDKAGCLPPCKVVL
jgi:hypothetical protein